MRGPWAFPLLERIASTIAHVAARHDADAFFEGIPLDGFVLFKPKQRNVLSFRISCSCLAAFHREAWTPQLRLWFRFDRLFLWLRSFVRDDRHLRVVAFQGYAHL